MIKTTHFDRKNVFVCFYFFGSFNLYLPFFLTMCRSLGGRKQKPSIRLFTRADIHMHYTNIQYEKYFLD